MMRNLLTTLSLSLLLVSSCSSGERQDEATIVYAGSTVGKELELTVSALGRFMEKNPGIRVHVRPTPRAYDEQLALFNQLLEAESPDVDVFQIDVVWTRAMAAHAYDLSAAIPQSELDKHFEIIVENNTVDGKLVGMPWYTDAPVLFYRKDLLAKYEFDSPPKTWDELEEMARKIQEGERQAGNLGFWGYVWQGRGYEGLTCNALEWQSSQGGGNFIDSDGKPAMNNPNAARAFGRAARWVGTISPPQVVDWAEEESRIPWLRGDAAFMRNWPLSHALSRESPVGDKFGVSMMPYGPSGAAAVLGGWQLMVSAHSGHPEAAAKLVAFLTSEEEQRIRAIAGTFNPTIKSLYQDPEILKVAPFFEEFNLTLSQAVRRPSSLAGLNYGKASQVYWTSVRRILTGGDAKEALESGEEQLAEILGE